MEFRPCASGLGFRSLGFVRVRGFGFQDLRLRAEDSKFRVKSKLLPSLTRDLGCCALKKRSCQGQYSDGFGTLGNTNPKP